MATAWPGRFGPRRLTPGVAGVTSEFMSDAAVSLEQVSKVFGDFTAVDGVDLTVPRGCVYGFIGPNGSGKTTTLRMILHILLPSRGRVVVLGNEDWRAANDRIAYLPEERGLYKQLSVERQLRYFGKLKGMREPELSRAIDGWLDRFDLQKWRKQKIQALSKGMGQKVQFIATIFSRPDLLILDEPFSGLDPVNLDLFREIIGELQDGGTTIIFSTHDMPMAERMCDRIFMIYRGQKVLDGRLADIQQTYGEERVRVGVDDPDAIAWDQLPGVTKVDTIGSTRELSLQSEADAQGILDAVRARAAVREFRLVRPSLHDIFVRIARPAPADEADLAEAGKEAPDA